MLTPSRLLLRRRGKGHVVKYLEGVPTPSKLIDHLAGANLHASAELPFYNTVPRYVDVQREQLLSQLFFHHVLYPAGGARLPYQAVVVRGGRAVRSSTPRVWKRPKPGSTQTESKGASATAAFSPSSTRPRVNPLAVPASQLGSSSSPSATALMEEVPSSAMWARVDPARRPYFSTKLPTASGAASRYRNTHADNGPAATNPYLSGYLKSARHDQSPLTRAIEDDILKPLHGVVEHYWNSKESAAAAEKEEGGNAIAARLERLLVSPSGGLLWLAEGGSSNATNSVNDTSVWERLVTSLRQRRAFEVHSTLPPRSTFTYVQTRLPPSATVVLPVEHNPAKSSAPAAVDGEGDAVRCRMAGGVEPVVPFAVGQPLRPSGETPLFSHITCLTRVDLQVAPLSPSVSTSPVEETASKGLSSTHGDDTVHNAAATRSRVASSSSPASPAEPWKLGPDGLDLMVPQHVRTVAEHHPAKSPSTSSSALPLRKAQPEQKAATAAAAALPASGGNGRYVVGRSDAETYLLPQRELLLTLYVPTHTEDMCAAQNNDRLQRQVRAGRAGGAVMAWPTEQARMTSARRAHGQYANAESAGRTGSTLPSTDKRGGASSEHLVSRTSYEVRALPGDVVYIPRGWGYDVQRILGTATVHIGQRVEQGSSSASRAAGTSALRHDFRDNRTLSGRRGSLSPPEVAVTDRGEENMANSTYTVEAVAVDAFCLHYHPYPELTAAQADVYVAANYVHAGVEQFYEKGGNDVFRAYR